MTALYIVGVNFASSKFAAKFVEEWLRVESVHHIWLVDNFSTKVELDHMRVISKKPRVTLIERKNDGYSAGLMAGLRAVKKKGSRHGLVLFGNVDVYPVDVQYASVVDDEVPMPQLLERGRNRNPFMTLLERRLLWLFIPASFFASRKLRLLASLVIRCVRLWRSNPWTIHGSLFSLPVSSLYKDIDVFPEGLFMYCEELFFGCYLEKNGLKLVGSQIICSHIGGVSTSVYIPKASLSQFKSWKRGYDLFRSLEK